MNLATLIARFDQDLDRIGNDALAEAAESLADHVRRALSTSPGGPHDHPWLQTGELRDSIEVNAEGGTAVVASTSATALYQEHGTGTIPPRRTFGPLAAAEGLDLADLVAHSVVTALRGS